MSPYIFVKVTSFWKFAILRSKCLEYGWSWEIFWWSSSIRELFWWIKRVLFLWISQCLEKDVTADERAALKMKKKMGFQHKTTAPNLLKLIRYFHFCVKWCIQVYLWSWMTGPNLLRTEVMAILCVALWGPQLGTHIVAAPWKSGD